MTKKKKKLTPERRARKEEIKARFKFVLINGKQKRVHRYDFENDNIFTDGSPFTNYLINLEIKELQAIEDLKLQISNINAELRVISHETSNFSH